MDSIRLLFSRKFAPLFWTQFFGAFNDNLLKNALVILIAFRTSQVMGIPAAQMVSVAGGIFILPFFLFSATAGQLADKYEKGFLIKIIKVVEIAIMLIATFGLMTSHFELLLVSLFMMGVHSAFFGPIKYSILPQHLTDKELIGGNALVEAGTFLSILLGTIAGGSLIALPDIGTAATGALLVAIAVFGLVACLFIPKAPAVDPSLKVQWNPITPTMEILKFTRANRAVFLSIMGISWFWFMGAAVMSLLPSFCKEVLHADSSVVTLFLACFSIGIGVGSMLCNVLSKNRVEIGLVPMGSIGISFFALDLAFSGRSQRFEGLIPNGATITQFLSTAQGWHVTLDLVFLAMFCGLYIVPMYALMQERSEATHRSRVIAGNNVINSIFMVVASGLLVGLMKLGFSIPQIFLTLGILNGLVSAYIYTVVPEFFLRFLMWIVANIMYRIKVEGRENIPARGPAILICNHTSFVDWMIIGAAIRRPVRFVMHYTFFRAPMKGLMTDAKVIPIAGAKEDPEILASAFRRIAEELNENHLVCVFPEGEITHDGELLPFRPGVEKFIQTTPVPVIPMALCGLWGSFFSRYSGRAMSKLPKRFWSRVELKITAPIEPQKVSMPEIQQIVTNLLASKD